MVEVSEKKILRKGVDPRLAYQGEHLVAQYMRSILRGKLPSAEEMVKGIHARLFKPLVPEDAQSILGCYRSTNAYIVGSGAEIVPYWMLGVKMREFGEELDRELKDLKYGADNIVPILETSASVHYDLVIIHPFSDGNGRVARRMMNLILQKFGCKPIIIGPINRKKYLDSLEKVNIDGNLEHFNLFLARRLLESYKGSQRGPDLQGESNLRHYIDKIEKRYLNRKKYA